MKNCFIYFCDLIKLTRVFDLIILYCFEILTRLYYPKTGFIIYPIILFVKYPLKQIVINPNKHFMACIFLLYRIILIGLVLIIGQLDPTYSIRNFGQLDPTYSRRNFGQPNISPNFQFRTNAT
jgi:hypothetical protein